MTWGARRRLVAFAAGLTLAVGLLAGLLLQMVFPIDYSQSLLEARFGWTVVLALLAVLLCLYVALPVAAAAVFVRENGHPLAYGGVAVAAILMPVLTPLAVAWALERTSGVPRVLPRLIGAAAALVAALGGGALAAERVGPPNRKTRWVFVLNIAVLGVFSAGFLGAQVAAPGFADRHTTDTQPDSTSSSRSGRPTTADCSSSNTPAASQHRWTDSTSAGRASPTSRAPTRPSQARGLARRPDGRQGAAARPSSRATR